MEKSSLASILQRKKNKNLTLAHRQLWGMIDLVYKDFYDKESKIYDAGNVTREEFSIIKHVYKTRHVVTYTELKALLNNKHLSHVGWVIKNLEKKGLVTTVKHWSDQRSRDVMLTKKGIRTYERISSTHNKVMGALFSQIPKEQREQTTRLLIHIHNRMAKKPIANFIDLDYIQ